MSDACQVPPCRHYADRAPSLCLIGRRAPHDCVCADYAEDLGAALSADPLETERREAWNRAAGAA